MKQFILCLIVTCLFILFGLFIPKAYALTLDCAEGEYMSGDCTGAFYEVNVDCDPYTTGERCCRQLAQSQGFTGAVSCSPACRQPTTGDICSYSSTSGCLNSSCGGTSVFCCSYSNPPPLTSQCPNGDIDCVDGNPCTEDICSNGTTCTHTNSPAGKICNASTGATCDGNGACIPPPPPPAPTCSSTNCGACPDCGSCINQIACGWTGSSCQAGTASCPAGNNQWYWTSCSVNVCSAPSPPPSQCTPHDCDALVPSCDQTTFGTIVDSSSNQTTCSKTGPACTSSCSVSWTLSNTNPPTNTIVTADVRGESIANATWTNVAYSLDGGGWNTGVQVTSSSIPTFRFSVPSGSANPHSLRFAIGNGSTVCSPPSSFTTQAPSQNDAATCTAISLNSQNIVANQNYTATVTMRNDGDTTWSPSGSFPYRLGAQQPQDDPNWGTSSGADSNKGIRPTRVNLSSQVPPGSSATFFFGVTAPDTAGTYRFSWQMLHEIVGPWFGGMCQPNITVNAPAFTFTPSCTGTVTNPQTRTIRWETSVIPATPPSGSYTYLWSQDASGTTPTVTQTYGTTGTKNAQVSVSNSGISNTANCSATLPDPFSYNLTNSGPKSVTQNSQVTNTITATRTQGTTQPVSFSASNFPSGVSSTFNPTSCNPTCSSTLTMNASQTAATGTRTITVTGTSTNVANQTTFFDLTVNPSGLPAAPTVSNSSLSCINPGYTGNGVNISWTNSGVTWVDIDSDSVFATPYYHKAVSGVLSTTGPSGFNANNGSGSLSLNPATTYFVRTFNGVQNSAVASFSIPACSAAVCGNNTCESGEPVSCPQDCPGITPGPDGPVCPNQKCEVGETPSSCPADCPASGPTCGNNICESGEPQSCPSDCPGVPACSGNINLTLNPNPAVSLTQVTSTASGLNSCGNTPVIIKTPDCNGTQVTSCTSGSSGCSASFSAPSTAGNYTYAACIDKTSPSDGDYTDPGESATTNLTVNPPGSLPSSTQWIQTTGGDVHSNVNISTPGGP